MLSLWKKSSLLAVLTGIFLHLFLKFAVPVVPGVAQLPLWFGIILGGFPFLLEMVKGLLKGKFGADFLAGVSVVTAVLMGELLVAAIIVLMLSGGQVLEEMATQRASRVLSALAKRSPTIAHRAGPSAALEEVAVSEIATGEILAILPYEICPVDGTVLSGDSTMDESFLTGEPFRIRKTKGSTVISGALNGEGALTIVADKLPSDSRYARIMRVVEEAENSPPPMRRLGDQLGALYTPFALLIATAAWLISGSSYRFLAVLVIATPCPLLLAIPIAIVGAVSLAAKRSIIIRKPAVLEQVSRVRTMLFDKTGTLTHGEPELTELVNRSNLSDQEVLSVAASLEQYSKHPLSSAVIRAAEANHAPLVTVESVSEQAGKGLTGKVGGHTISITGRRGIPSSDATALPAFTSGMESILLIDNKVAGLMRFHDRPRQEGLPFIKHLHPKHHIQRLMILSGDRDEEVQRLARIVGVEDVRAGLSPEQKLNIVAEETAKAPTLFLGDGINDAPAMLAATVGVAFGKGSDITAEAASAVILDTSLERVDQLLHIGSRMRRIALESAVGGICLSMIGMIAASFGYLPPFWGALAQEAIDLLAVLNALRVSLPYSQLQDFR